MLKDGDILICRIPMLNDMARIPEHISVRTYSSSDPVVGFCGDPGEVLGFIRAGVLTAVKPFFYPRIVNTDEVLKVVEECVKVQSLKDRLIDKIKKL